MSEAGPSSISSVEFEKSDIAKRRSAVKELLDIYGGVDVPIYYNSSAVIKLKLFSIVNI